MPSKYIGSHVSIKKGVCSLPKIMKSLDADTCQFFTKGPMRFSESKISNKERESFKKLNISAVVHGSYLTNLCNVKEKTLDNFYDDIQATQDMGIKYYIFHPGSDVNKVGIDKALDTIAEELNKALEKFKDIVLCIEIMAGQGKVVPFRLEQIKQIIDKVKDIHKPRVGVCLDTCHMFAAGYDISTKESYDKVMDKVDKVLGLDVIKVLHLNDSKFKLNSKKDRHEHLGDGEIGINAFKFIMEDARLDCKIFILETPDEGKYKEEIKKLKSFLS